MDHAQHLKDLQEYLNELEHDLDDQYITAPDRAQIQNLRKAVKAEIKIIEAEMKALEKANAVLTVEKVEAHQAYADNCAAIIENRRNPEYEAHTHNEEKLARQEAADYQQDINKKLLAVKYQLIERLKINGQAHSQNPADRSAPPADYWIGELCLHGAAYGWTMFQVCEQIDSDAGWSWKVYEDIHTMIKQNPRGKSLNPHEMGLLTKEQPVGLLTKEQPVGLFAEFLGPWNWKVYDTESLNPHEMGLLTKEQPVGLFAEDDVKEMGALFAEVEETTGIEQTTVTVNELSDKVKDEFDIIKKTLVIKLFDNGANPVSQIDFIRLIEEANRIAVAKQTLTDQYKSMMSDLCFEESLLGEWTPALQDYVTATGKKTYKCLTGTVKLATHQPHYIIGNEDVLRGEMLKLAKTDRVKFDALGCKIVEVVKWASVEKIKTEFGTGTDKVLNGGLKYVPLETRMTITKEGK